MVPSRSRSFVLGLSAARTCATKARNEDKGKRLVAGHVHDLLRSPRFQDALHQIHLAALPLQPNGGMREDQKWVDQRRGEETRGMRGGESIGGQSGGRQARKSVKRV